MKQIFASFALSAVMASVSFQIALAADNGYLNPTTWVVSAEKESADSVPYTPPSQRESWYNVGDKTGAGVKDTSGLYAPGTTVSPTASAAGAGGSAAAAPAGTEGAAGAAGAWEKKAEEGGGSFVYVTEKIPGAGCTDAWRWTSQTTRLYRCPVWSGFDTVVGVLGSLIKYATYLTGLIGVLMIVLSGIQYSLSGGGENAKKAKERIIQLITGLVLLFLTWLVLNTVAPWVYK